MGYPSIKPEVRARVVELCKQGAMQSEIAEALHIGKSSVSTIWRDYLIQHPEDSEAFNAASKEMQRIVMDEIPVKTSPAAPSPVRHCPNCGESVMQKAAKFCWACGADVRDRHLILLEKVRKSVHSRVNLLPNNLRDEFNQVVLEVEDLLMKEAEG